MRIVPKQYVYLGISLILSAIVAWQAYELQALGQSVNTLRTTVAVLDTEVVALSEDLASSTRSTIAVRPPLASSAEVARRQQVVAKSQDQLLQEAVARVTPAVVSIVETREVPLLQVTYENPFGNDPFFRDFGVQVPVYRQVGTTTQKVGAGTGFFVRSNGYIVTNRHVVPDTDASYTVLLANGKQMPAAVVWRSADQDLAIVKISGGDYATVPLGDSATLNLGESVFAVGNALGEYNNSVSVGIVSGLNRTITAATGSGRSETLEDVIQTDAAINQGNSGGPLVDLSGRVVGVNVATVQGSQSIGFSIPINQVRQALNDLRI